MLPPRYSVRVATRTPSAKPRFTGSGDKPVVILHMRWFGLKCCPLTWYVSLAGARSQGWLCETSVLSQFGFAQPAKAKLIEPPLRAAQPSLYEVNSKKSK